MHRDIFRYNIIFSRQNKIVLHRIPIMYYSRYHIVYNISFIIYRIYHNIVDGQPSDLYTTLLRIATYSYV